jgi:hypothetical protein
VRTLLRSPGKPFHPPLTDASIGAYTGGVVMLVLGALGVEESRWRTVPCWRSRSG